MSALQLLLVLACVALIACGQVLFKVVALLSTASAHPWSDPKTLSIGIASLALYGFATLLWIWLLRSVPLAKAYPFMALSFVLVPAAGILFFDERVTGMYGIGLGLIVLGVLLIARYGQG